MARPPFCHDTNDCIVTHNYLGLPSVTIQQLYRDTLHQPSRAQGRVAGRVTGPLRRIVAQSDVSWPMTGRIVACHYVPARPCRGRALPVHARPVSQYSLLYCDLAQLKMGSSLGQLPATLFFFFTSFFFHLFHLLEDPKKKKKKNSFSSRTK